MFAATNDDWRAKRRTAAQSAILGMAWELAREHGLAGLSLRDLARRLGMAAPTLYSYFASKHALYDAMFASGNRALLAAPAPAEAPDVRTTLRNQMKAWIDFALEDPVRAQLLNQRTIPGFEPSTESYALAQEAYERAFAPLETLVDLAQEDRDLVTAVVGGLLNQQFANDPGGTRWVRLLDDAVDLLVPRLQSKKKSAPATRGRPTGKKESP